MNDRMNGPDRDKLSVSDEIAKSLFMSVIEDAKDMQDRIAGALKILEVEDMPQLAFDLGRLGASNEESLADVSRRSILLLNAVHEARKLLSQLPKPLTLPKSPRPVSDD